jgi:hypothetical protein
MSMLIAVLLTFAVPQASAPSTPNLAFVAGLAGQRPSEAKLLERPAMRERLATLLKADAPRVAERLQTENPIEKKGDVVAFFGNKAHAGGSDDVLVVINTKTDTLWVWLRVNGAVKRFGPAADPSGLPDDAGVWLKNLSGGR